MVKTKVHFFCVYLTLICRLHHRLWTTRLKTWTLDPKWLKITILVVNAKENYFRLMFTCSPIPVCSEVLGYHRHTGIVFWVMG